MNIKPLVSVAVSCYNFEKYIYLCLESLANQKTNFTFEIVVVDDCSPDHSIQEINKAILLFPQLITLIKHPSNLGSDQTKQTACIATQGKYVAFLDGDDFSYQGKLQAQFDYLESNQDCILCYHDMGLVDENDESLEITFSESFYNQSYIPEKSSMQELVLYGTFLVASSQMFRIEAFKEALLPANVKIVQDFFYHVHSAHLGMFGRIDKVLGSYRVHQDSYTGKTNLDPERRLTCLNDILLACDYAQKLGLPEKTVQQGKSHFYFAAAVYFLKKEHFSYFQMCIDNSAQWQLFFDDRHKKLYQYKNEPAKALKYIQTVSYKNKPS